MSSGSIRSCLLLLSLALGVVSCDRGASLQINAARRLADAVTRNDAVGRDSMIATSRYREYFQNPYVASDELSWFRTFYDFHTKQFTGQVSADVDRDLKKELEPGLISQDSIEATGMVKVKPETPGEEPAFFWMVKQQGKQWKVAMVTKGEMVVNF